MSSLRSNVLTFGKLRSSNRVSRVTKLWSVNCAMLPANSRRPSEFASKAARLHAAAPDIAQIVEVLIDELLTDIA